jgi:hypothetical protein
MSHCTNEFDNMAGMMRDAIGRVAYVELADRLGIEGETEEFLQAMKVDAGV